jgi:hypothetical protein
LVVQSQDLGVYDHRLNDKGYGILSYLQNDYISSYSLSITGLQRVEF